MSVAQESDQEEWEICEIICEYPEGDPFSDIAGWMTLGFVGRYIAKVFSLKGVYTVDESISVRRPYVQNLLSM